MSRRVDDILAAIDVGLQTPVPDPAFGEVSPVEHGLCIRCERRPTVATSDFCGPCRSYLLGDAQELPKRREDIARAIADHHARVASSGIVEYENGGFFWDLGELDLGLVREHVLNSSGNELHVFAEEVSSDRGLLDLNAAEMLDLLSAEFLATPNSDVVFGFTPRPSHSFTGCWWACEHPGRPTDGYVRWHYFNCTGCFDRARLLLADHPDDSHVRWLANRIGIT